MYLIRIELTGKFPCVLELSPPGGEKPALFIVRGPNGSGKSLMVSAAATALGDDRFWDSLLGAGAERVLLDGVDEGRLAHMVCDVAGRRRDFRWEDAPAEYLQPREDKGRRPPRGPNGNLPEPSALPTPDLLRLVNVCRSGQLNVPRREALQRAVLSVVRAPLERELDGWTARRTDLSGSAGDGGHVAAARANLDKAEQELARVESMWRHLELLRSRQEELSARLVEVRTSGEVLAAEADVLGRLCTSADRAARLEAWIEEIRQESREVQKLREKHVRLQTRLDELEQRFRGAPDDLADVLSEYEAARSRESRASVRLVELRAERARQQAELESLRSEAALPQPPWEEEAIRRQDELRAEIEAVNGQLTELLRTRIELVRQREGIGQQIARDFAQFTALESAERVRLETILSGDAARAVPAENRGRDIVRKGRERSMASLKGALRERFAGFEGLRPSISEMLREYHDARRVLRTLSGDLDGLRHRISILRRKTHSRQSIIAGAAAGVLGFAAATLLWSWDVGVFAALAASGLSLLVFRYNHRGVDMELESAGAAEAMIQRRVEETRATKIRLEKSLGPLADAATLDAGLSRYEEYVHLREQLSELESESEREPESADDLPAAFRETPLPVLRRLFENYVELEGRSAELDSEWRGFETGGAQAERIRCLEERLESLRQEHAALLAEAQTHRSEHEARRAELGAHIAELERAPDGEGIARVEAELTEIRSAMTALESASGGLLRESTAATVSVEWTERETLRANLRETRSQLSAKQTQDELKARQALLAEEAAEMRQKLGALDPLYLLDGSAAEYAAKYAGQLRAARSNLSDNAERLKDLQRQLESAGGDELLAALNNERPLEELQSAAAEHRQRLESLERDLVTTRELIALISDEIAEKEAALPAELSAAVDRWLQALTDEHCLGMEEREGMWLVDCADGGPRKLETFSDGLCDMVAIAVRLAVFEVVGEADSTPVIWDEPLWRLDEQNLARLREPLARLARTRQVILFTRSSALEDWGIPLRLGGEVQPQASPSLIR